MGRSYENIDWNKEKTLREVDKMWRKVKDVKEQRKFNE